MWYHLFYIILPSQNRDRVLSTWSLTHANLPNNPLMWTYVCHWKLAEAKNPPPHSFWKSGVQAIGNIMLANWDCKATYENERLVTSSRWVSIRSHQTSVSHAKSMLSHNTLLSPLPFVRFHFFPIIKTLSSVFPQRPSFISTWFTSFSTSHVALSRLKKNNACWRGRRRFSSKAFSSTFLFVNTLIFLVLIIFSDNKYHLLHQTLSEQYSGYASIPVEMVHHIVLMTVMFWLAMTSELSTR